MTRAERAVLVLLCVFAAKFLFSAAARFVPAEAVLRACPELRPDGCGGVAERFRFPGAPGSVGLIRP